MASVSGGNLLAGVFRAMGQKVDTASSVEIGFLENSTYPDGTSVPMVAAIQEYGAPRAGIPPRPFFRNMIAAKSGEWPGAVAQLLKDTGYDAHQTLDRAGQAIAGQLKQSVADLQDPPLSPVTLMVRQIIGPNGRATLADVLEARRRVEAGEVASGVSTKPLVWTGHLLNSVDHRVE